MNLREASRIHAGRVERSTLITVSFGRIVMSHRIPSKNNSISPYPNSEERGETLILDSHKLGLVKDQNIRNSGEDEAVSGCF
jgi:hypothetical protein